MERIWWEKVPNALAFLSDITNSLLEEKSIILQASADIPWHAYMETAIKDSVRQRNSSKRFEMIRNVEGDPGTYILKEYCKPEKRVLFRPPKSPAKFLAENDDIVLHSRYLWVVVSSLQVLRQWSDFVSEYRRERGKGKEAAVFILEYCKGDYIPAKKGIKIYSFDDYIGEYDRTLFSMLAASSVKENRILKNYLAELVSNVTENDIELSAKCLENYKEFLSNPAAVIREIVSVSERSDSRAFSFTKSQEAVNHAIWLAQIRTIYPVLEEFRERFVERYSQAIQKELPIASAYGEACTNFRDIELGTLVFMAGGGKLYLSSMDYEQLVKYKNARNRLSHLNILKFEEICQLDL